MIFLKETVKLTDLQPQMAIALVIVAEFYRSKGIPNITITSVNDSKHMDGSLHYKGRALDFRTHDITLTNRQTWLTSTFLTGIKTALGPDFDCVVEDISGPNEHLHVEYDPKEIKS